MFLDMNYLNRTGWVIVIMLRSHCGRNVFITRNKNKVERVDYLLLILNTLDIRGGSWLMSGRAKYSISLSDNNN